MWSSSSVFLKLQENEDFILVTINLGKSKVSFSCLCFGGKKGGMSAWRWVGYNDGFKVLSGVRNIARDRHSS